VKDLKMKKTFHTSNMHLFHPTRGIHKYANAEEILRDFVELRLEHYKKRKAHLVDVFRRGL
jgi:DNA topoisomerase II